MIVLELKILESGLLVGKFLLINLRNAFPNFVVRDRLKGGLYQMMRLLRFLRVLVLLSVSPGWGGGW